MSPGVEVTREITFSNAGPTDVQLSQIKTLNSQEFWVVAAAGADATRLTVPRATRDANGRWVPGTAKLTVANKPLQLGPRQTQLQFQTSLPRQATGVVTLKGFGGGPDIQVTPAPSLNFGKVAYFAGVELLPEAQADDHERRYRAGRAGRGGQPAPRQGRGER